MGYRLNNAQQFLGVHSSATSLTLLYPPADYLGAAALVGSSSPYTQYYSDGNQWIGVYDENTISTTRLRNHFRKVWERNRQKAGYGVLYVPNTANVVYIDPTASTDGAGTVASPRNILPATVANNTTYLFKERTTLNLTDTRWGTGVGAGTIFGTYESYTGNRILTDLSRLATINFTSASTNTQIFNLTATNTNVTFSGVRFTCPDVMPGRRDAIYAGTASTSINTVIEYCYFEGIDSRPASGIPLGSCIFSFSDNIVVRFNTARNNICDIMWMGENASKVGGKNPHIYGNDFIVPVVDRDGPDALQISYDMTGTGHPMQLKITDNWLEINSNQKQCLVSNGSNVADGRGYVARNVFWGHDMSGPVLGTNNSKTVEWQLSNTIFESNVFRGGHYGLNLAWPTDVRGNIFIADHTTFGDTTLTTLTKYYGIVLPGSTTNQVRVTNNTFIRIGDEAIGMAIQQYTDSTQHVIANNIILGKFFRGISMKVGGQTETNNCVIGPATPYANHSTGAALTGTNAVLVDPLLDATLTPTSSSMRNAGSVGHLLPFTDVYDTPYSKESNIIGAIQKISDENTISQFSSSTVDAKVLGPYESTTVIDAQLNPGVFCLIGNAEPYTLYYSNGQSWEILNEASSLQKSTAGRIPITTSAVVVPSTFVGLHTHLYPVQTYGTLDPAPAFPYGTCRSYVSLLHWRHIETSAGVYDWSRLDAYITNSFAAGRDFIYTVYGTPTFYASPADQAFNDLFNNAAGAANPTSLAALGSFITAMVNRYNKVSAVNPTGARMLTMIEVWNEPNFLQNRTGYWWGSATQLIDLAKTVYTAAKAADPLIKILSPGLDGTSAESYFSARGTDNTDPKTLMDMLVFHPYFGCPGQSSNYLRLLPKMRDILGFSPSAIGYMKAIRDSIGSSVDLGISEYGFVDNQVDADVILQLSTEDRYRFMWRVLACAAAAGMKMMCIYAYMGPSINYNGYNTMSGNLITDTYGVIRALSDFHTQIVGKTIQSAYVYTDGRVSVTTNVATYTV